MKKRIRRKQQRRCKNKQRFDYKYQAYGFLKILPFGTIYMKAYKCPICKKWHIACANKELKILYLLKQLEIEKDRIKNE